MPVVALAAALAALLRRGLAQSPQTVHALESAYGDASAPFLAGLIARREESEAATALDLLLFPGPEAFDTVERALEGRGLSPAQATGVEEALERAVRATRALMPGGEEVPIPLEPGDLGAFLRRLRLETGCPPELSAAVLRRFGPEQGRALLIILRHRRAQLDVQGLFFLLALVDRVDAAGRDVADVLEWSLRFLAGLPSGDVPQEALGRKRRELASQLRRALDFQEAMEKGSFEILAAQGVRAPHLHAPDLRRELELLDMACLAVTGRPGWLLAPVTDEDLGQAVDAQALFDALNRDAD